MKTFHSYIDLVNIWVISHPEMTIKWDNSSRILGMLYFCTKLIKTCCNDLILSLIISTWIPKWMFQLTCCNLFLSRILKKKSFYVYEFLWKGIPEASFTVIFRRERRAWMSEDRREKRGEGWRKEQRKAGKVKWRNNLVMTSLCFIQGKSVHGLPESVPHRQ